MTYRQIRTPVYVYSCDVCGRQVESDELPAGWLVRVPGYGVSNTHICDICRPGPLMKSERN